jgi:hypothetical protein
VNGSGTNLCGIGLGRQVISVSFMVARSPLESDRRGLLQRRGSDGGLASATGRRFKSNNSFLWRRLTASGSSPNTSFLSPRCPPTLLAPIGLCRAISSRNFCAPIRHHFSCKQESLQRKADIQVPANDSFRGPTTREEAVRAVRDRSET